MFYARLNNFSCYILGYLQGFGDGAPLGNKPKDYCACGQVATFFHGFNLY